MAPKPSTRPVVKVGGCTTDWSRSVYDDRGWPVLGGAGWIRLGQWVQFSRNHVVLGTLMNARSRVSVQVPDLSVHADCSTVIMQRCMEKGVAELVCMARSNGQRVINDLDDWFWQISDKNAAANFIDPKKNANSNIDHYRKTLESSDLVTVSTPFLYDRISEWDIPAKLIENRVSVHMFSRRKHREGTPVLGWVGSTAHRSGDLEILRSPFRALGRQVRFHHTGAHPQHPQFHDEVGLESDQVSTTPMLSPYEYPAGFTFDIGVVPLVDVPFNHAKCVDANTRIPTDRGVIPARELQVGDSVTHNGDWYKIKGMEKSTSRPGLQFTLEDGYLIKITPEHRMFVNSEFREARHVQVGDTFTLQSSPASLTYQTIPWPTASRASRKVESDHHAYVNALSVPRLTIDERWGRFLGAFAGDGCLSKTSVSIACDGQDQDWIDSLIDDFKEMGLTAGTEQHTMFDGTVLRRRSVRIASADMVRTLELLGLTQISEVTQRNMRKVCVPEVIWRSPSSVVAEFLSAYFEADGCASGTGVHACSKSEEFVRAVQTLLLIHFGIVSKVFPKQHKSQTQESTYWHISLSRAASDVFEKCVGFKSRRKIDRLRTITEKPHSNRFRPMSYEKKVVDIQPCFVECPVDIEVEGSVFIAAGMVSHNSNIKGLEYAAAGIPFVASPLPEYVRLRDQFGIGRIASNSKEWQDHIEELLDPAVRFDEATRQRDAVQTHFHVKAMAKDFDGVVWA